MLDAGMARAGAAMLALARRVEEAEAVDTAIRNSRATELLILRPPAWARPASAGHSDMSYLDAYFGRVYANGVPIELGAGVNYSAGLTVGTSGTGTSRCIDVTVSDAIRALTPLASALRIAGVGILEGVGSTALNNTEYTPLTGVFTGGAKSDAVLTPSTSEAQFTYSGVAGRMLVITSGGAYSIDANTTTLALYVGVDQLGGVRQIDCGSGYSTFATCGLIVVAPGDVITLRATTDVASVAFENHQLSMIAVAIQDAIS
jgi:hypothetical protein